MNEKITFEEHEIIGMIGKILNVKLSTGSVETFRKARTKVQGRKDARHYDKAEKHLSKFRHHMEEIMFKENPEKANTGIYYGVRENLNILEWLDEYLQQLSIMKEPQ